MVQVTADGPVLVWPPGCALPGCRHHYGRGRNLGAEGCTCPGWPGGGGWHLTGTSAACTSPAHIPAHMVFPLDAHEAEWRCRTCGHVFTCAAGWVTCPRDPDPPAPRGPEDQPGSRPPVHVPLLPAVPGPGVDGLLARLRAWADGHAWYGPAADFTALDQALGPDRAPYPTRWADRPVTDTAQARRAGWLADVHAGLADAVAAGAAAAYVTNAAVAACPRCACQCGQPGCEPTTAHYAAAGTICPGHQRQMAVYARFSELAGWLAAEFPP